MLIKFILGWQLSVIKEIMQKSNKDLSYINQQLQKSNEKLLYEHN